MNGRGWYISIYIMNLEDLDRGIAIKASSDHVIAVLISATFEAIVTGPRERISAIIIDYKAESPVTVVIIEANAWLSIKECSIDGFAWASYIIENLLVRNWEDQGLLLSREVTPSSLIYDGSKRETSIYSTICA